MTQPEPQNKTLRQRAAQWLREQAKVEIILPVLLAAGLLAYVASVAVAPHSATEIWSIVRQTWLLILVLTIPYLGLRALVWQQLLNQLGIRVPWRQLVVAFAGGELTKSLPAGAYTQNYLLGRLEHFSRLSLIRSTMATTAMLGLETFIALPVALIIGLRGDPWLFWTLIGVVGAWIVVLSTAWVLVRRIAVKTDGETHPWLRRGAVLASEFLEAGGDLIALCTVRSLVPTALYMVIYAIDLYAITLAAGVNSVSFSHIMAVYAIVVLAVVLVPIPTELGITEFTGLGALEAYGVPSATAAVIMLSLRVLATGMTIVVAGLLFLFMRGELAAARKEESEGVPGGETALGG